MAKILLISLVVLVGTVLGEEEEPVRVHWVPLNNGQLPPHPVHAQSAAVFCEVDVASKGQAIPGVTNNGECEIEVDGKVQRSSDYRVLVKDEGTHTGWRYSSSGPPERAVKCNEGPDCYLGFSVYGDGACEELPGKIFPSQKKMIMVSGSNVYSCSLMMYLVVKPLPKTAG